MPTVKRLYNQFIRHLTEYIQLNGDQTLLQIKGLAKQYCIQSRNGVYDITARKRYFYLFMNYLLRNNLGVVEGWGGEVNSPYDPDNELPNDPRVIRLKRNEEIRTNNLITQLEIEMAQMGANED
jgi:hypothetical protein